MRTSEVKVGIIVSDNEGTGIGNYAYELTESIKDVGSINAKIINISGSDMILPEKYISLRSSIKKALSENEFDVDVYHLTSQQQAIGLIGWENPVPTIATVHDLAPLITEYSNPVEKLFAKYYLRGLENVDHIISISKNTKSDIMTYMSIDEDEIDVIYPSIRKGPETGVFRENDKNNRKNNRMNHSLDYDISNPYILYVGSQLRRKNLQTLLNALRDVPDEVTLVIVGSAGRIPRLKTSYYMYKYGVADQVLRTGFIQDRELKTLYRSALAFVFPSKYEGFGRPPLEAMSLGTPVIATSAGPVPEVVGEAAILCDPENPNEWADEINNILQNSKLREELKERGKKQSMKFSWRRCAKKTGDVYKSTSNNIK